MSRVAGFGRDVAIASFFGTGVAADAYAAALRIPNILRNLLGEGTLSASFIPVYSGMLGRDADSDARRLAGTVLSLLIVLATVLSGLGVFLAPWITRALVPGWDGESVDLAARLVRILFPMAGFMILAGWCLGVLNSHRRFFLSFAAPTTWNLTQIVGLLIAWKLGWAPLIIVLAWSTLIGGVLQFAVQLPAARRLAGSIDFSLDINWPPVRLVIRNFAPVVVGAGVAQLSGFLDVFLASFLAHGAVATLYYAQRLYYLPISLFGTSVAAASLPELSREVDSAAHEAVRSRLAVGFRGIAFAVLPSALAFIVFGDWILALLFQRGDFTAQSTLWVYATLSAYSIGLLAAASVKLFASGYHAMLDTRTPVRFAAIALVVGAVTGAVLMWRLYAPGLALGAAVGSWAYLFMLWGGLGRRLGRVLDREDFVFLLKLMVAGISAAMAGVLFELAAAPGSAYLADLPTRLWVTSGTLALFGVVYLAITKLLGVSPPGGLRVWQERAA